MMSRRARSRHQRLPSFRFYVIAVTCFMLLATPSTLAFVVPSHSSTISIPSSRCTSFKSPSSSVATTATFLSTPTSSSSSNSNSYVRQNEGPLSPKKTQPLYPKVGDIVRYYDLDGGRQDGQVLVGRISYIQKQLQKGATKGWNNNNKNKDANKDDPSNSSNNSKDFEWLVELSELEDIGDGYYATYSMRQRNSKKALRRLQDVAPIAASFVKSENAYKVPRDKITNVPLVRAEQYDVKGYLGPFGGVNEINPNVVAQDAILYAELKGQLLRNAAIVGVIGTLVADLVKGTEDAIIYATGVVASLAYLFFLSVKTDTIASPTAKFGSNIANLRFLMPIVVVMGIALYNQSLGDANPLANPVNPFDRITPEQFAAAMFGFLTYRIPLFLSQIQAGFQDAQAGTMVLPGSAGVVLQQFTQQTEATAAAAEEAAALAAAVAEQQLTPILVISGPQATGRSTLVQRLAAESGGTYVLPKLLDRYQDGASFERMEKRGELLQVDPTGRFGLTKQGILSATKDVDTEQDASSSSSTERRVVVVDASVELARKLINLSGTRLIGVWIGLSSVDDFKTRLETMIDNGEIAIPEDETKDSIVRARIREIVKEIEFGVVSGIFEFTILNDDEEQSMQQLKEAASYAFR